MTLGTPAHRRGATVALLFEELADAINELGGD